MSEPIQSRGRGRGRGRSTVHSDSYLSPLVSLASSISAPSPSSSVINDDQSESGFSSASSDIQSCVSSHASIDKDYSRGRGVGIKKSVAPPDPYWIVTNLTNEEFKSNIRPTKPDELGTLGDKIQVIANYFPILHFPHKGLVYKYYIQILNKKTFEIHRDRRRLLYNSWLQGYCRQYPQTDKHKVVFDNQHTVLAFDQPLTDITDHSVAVMINGPNRANRQEQHKVIVQLVGEPVDLSMIRNLHQLFDRTNLFNERLEELQNVEQVLSIALHEHCSSHAEFIYNRSFYTPTINGQHGEWDLGLGKAMWRGFYSCLVFAKGTHQLLMNLDVRHTVFMKKQPFLDFLCEVMLQSPMGKREYGRQRGVLKVDGDDVLRFLDSNNPTYRNEMDYLSKHCKRLRVRSQDANKPIIYEIEKLGLPASKQKFVWKSNKNREVTVEEYYKEHYNMDLEFPSLPTLGMRSGTYLPMELVDVEPVRIKKITDDQRALMCRYSTIKPLLYCKAIDKIRRDPKQQCFEQDPFVAAWNLNVDTKMLTLPARVLPMPEIVYTNHYRVIPERVRDLGAWEVRSTEFYKPSSFPTVWGMINLSSINQNMCEDFYRELSNIAEQRGLSCPPPEIYEALNGADYSIENIVTKLTDMIRKNMDCKFFLVVLPDRTVLRTRIYGCLKKLCELEFGFGIVTQMIRHTNVIDCTKNNRVNWSCVKLNNILLKINTKLNGTNCVLGVPALTGRFFSHGHRIMYVGADLSHAAPGNITQPSIVAVVASADDVPNRYFKEVYQQHRPPQARGQSREFIVDMREIMKSLISQYAKHRGYPPSAIVFYRDGISESEFDSVFEKELTGIREACTDLSPVYRPYLTYIVVSKRHHTRLFPVNSDKNVLAGTVVDSHDITNATTYDFYLNSHHGALGTSRPTHYHVLYDDNKLKPDEVQMLTYALCYTYARCTRAVSIPAPVKYADLLAARATLYIQMDDQSDTESVASGQRIPTNENVDIHNSIKSERIVLSSKIAPDCPFFL